MLRGAAWPPGLPMSPPGNYLQGLHGISSSKTSASKHTGSVKCLLFLPLILLLPKNCHPPDSPEERQRSSRCPDSKELDSTPQNKEKQVRNTQGGL